ncbi:MAG: nitroreductase family protein [bacterium]
MMSNIYDVVCCRRTIRRFKNTPLPEELFIKLINAARLAPSGANLQPCEYLVIDEPHLVDSVFSCLKWAGYIAPAGNPPPGKRPVSYIVVLIDLYRKKKGGSVDAAAAIENMLLTAWGEGVGSCWLGSIDRKRIKKMLRIPHHLDVNSVVALGYPDEQPRLEESDHSVKYWKDKNGVLHVPKRKLEDLCHRNGYGLKPEI